MPPDTKVLHQALEWQVTFWSGEVTETERSEFQRWLSSDERHAAAWTQIQKSENTLASMAAPGAATTLRSSRQMASRRKSLRALGILIGAGTLFHFGRQTPEWQSLTADYHAAHGQRKDITLADGTQVTLNTSTSIDFVFDSHQRLIRLRNGEIFVISGPKLTPSGEMLAPLLVETAEGTVRPIGTQFNVRQEKNSSLVAVIEGAVDITPRKNSQSVRLLAGHKTSFDQQEVARTESSPANDIAWTKGLLVAERMRLQDFVAELARYRRGYLRCDPAVADLIVSGVYSVDNTDATITSLVDALPIRVQYVSRYWVSIHAL
jgi:transmembrane sensor